MPRNVFSASLFHLSPTAIEWLLREDTYRMRVAHTPFKDGLLMQCDSGRRGGRVDLTREANAVFSMAPPGTTHLFFREDGPTRSLPLHDRDAVLATYADPPFAKICDDSAFAESGFNTLREDDPQFSIFPSYFEGRANQYADQLNALEGSLENRWELEEIIDSAYALACGVEHTKLGTTAEWSASDAAFQRLGLALDPFIDAFERAYTSDLQYLENIILGTRSRVCRSSGWRITGET